MIILIRLFFLSTPYVSDMKEWKNYKIMIIIKMIIISITKIKSIAENNKNDDEMIMMITVSMTIAIIIVMIIQSWQE